MNDMAYAATDRNNPDVVWALTVDNPARARDVAERVRDWITQGAVVLYMPVSEASKKLENTHR